MEPHVHPATTGPDPSRSFIATATQQVWDFPDLILKSRIAAAIASGAARYPVCRRLRFAARTELDPLFDSIALDLGYRAERLDASALMLDGDEVFIVGRGGRKASYCSCHFSIWARTPQAAEHARASILALVEDSRIVEPMFSIDWHFLTGRGELESASIEELADDVLLDEAYPDVEGGINGFIDRYLRADETVLVLQGPPGTGKTRLIRAILGEISRRRGGEAQALYTGDMKSLENDQIFVRFITGWEDAFVVEDADHLLKPRAQGNEHLHRFLTIADGVVRSQGRKIIFSTNLPNVGDLDDALTRPGRCFARLYVRALGRAEAELLLGRLCAGRQDALAAARQALASSESSTHSLAEVYRAARTGR